jgi:hypothetical protein
LQGPPKIYLNWDFWFENIPSGNPGLIAAEKIGRRDSWKRKEEKRFKTFLVLFSAQIGSSSFFPLSPAFRTKDFG